jgi:LacI family transcriptional regulator
MATLRDVAQSIGLSISTVSRALSGHPHISEATRQRVREAATQLNYQPNSLARALRANETKTVGLVIPDILNHFYAAAATVLQRTLEREGYRLLISISHDDPVSDQNYLTALVHFQVDGIVHVPCSRDGARIIRKLGSETPVIELNRHTDTGVFDSVIQDDRDGTFQLTRHLISLGHRHIAFIVGAEHLSTTRDRVSGFREAFQHEGLPWAPTSISYGEYSLAWGTEAVRRLITTSNRPTAIFACGNQIALGVLHEIAEAGLRVPADISVVGFDDPEWYSVWRPAITTYALPLEETGLLAAQLLLNRMAASGLTSSRPTTTRLSGRVVIRDSCSHPYKGINLPR